jgi:acyl-homoserine lactone acylase PvdQ
VRFVPRKEAGRLGVALLALSLFALLVPVGAGARPDIARQILPPGAHGGLPTTANSTDQLELYDALTPLRGNVRFRHLNRLFLPENFRPVGAITREQTGRVGLGIFRDRYGMPHIRAKTRSALMFGSGWVAAKDRGLLLQLGRGPARLAVADVPGVNAFGLVTSGRPFVPSAQAEALITRQRRMLVARYGAKGRQMLRDWRAYARGVTAYWRSVGGNQPAWTVNDVIATNAFIGSIFGDGGGQEARNSDFLAKLRAALGGRRGTRAFNDLMAANDPEAPTTTSRRFRYPRFTGGGVRGSLVVDPGSVELIQAPPRPQASNFLTVAPSRSRTGDPLAVMGPQLGYFYPEIVYQVDLRGPGVKAQGVSVPGGGGAVLIGRTPHYAWSLTTANGDLRDQYLERLCEPDGSAPTRQSTHYVFRNRCRAMGSFNAGVLDGSTQLGYRTTVHGPVQGTALVDGRPYAIASRRSSFGREALSLAALHDMTAGRARSPRRFFQIANQFDFSFNWAYLNRRHTAFFSSGLLPRRARGLDRMLPTLGTGRYEWRGFLPRSRHPHDVDPRGGLFLNWNNKAAPGYMHGDEVHSYGSVHRVDMFDRIPRRADIVDMVSVMNRAATEDVRVTEVWPVIVRVLRGSQPPDALTGQAAELLGAWADRGGSRIDRNLDGFVDDPGAAVMDAAWDRFAEAVMRPVLGETTADLARIMGRDSAPYRSGGNGSSFGSGWYGYVDKDLRTVLGQRVRGRFNLRYCGRGSLSVCRASLWAALQGAAQALAAAQGPVASAWRADATLDRIDFQPGLIPNTMRWTNRPTFQQVLRFNRP